MFVLVSCRVMYRNVGASRRIPKPVARRRNRVLPSNHAGAGGANARSKPWTARKVRAGFLLFVTEAGVVLRVRISSYVDPVDLVQTDSSSSRLLLGTVKPCDRVPRSDRKA